MINNRKNNPSTFNLSSLEEMQVYLDNMQGSENDILSNQWNFKGHSNLTLDFDRLNAISDGNCKFLEGSNIGLIDLAKITVIYGSKDFTSVAKYKYIFDTLCKTFIYLKDFDHRSINKNNLVEYFSFLLMNDYSNGKVIRRLIPINVHTFKQGLSIDSCSKIVKMLNLNICIFSSNFSYNLITSTLKKCIHIITAGELTFADWSAGGSLNRLTLDYGKYYIEHCYDLYYEHIYLACALKKTFHQYKKISISAGFNFNDELLISQIKPIIGNFLSGISIDDLPKNYHEKHVDRLILLERETKNLLIDNIKIYRSIIKLRTENTANLILDKLGLENSQNRIDFIIQYSNATLDLHFNSDSNCININCNKEISNLKSISMSLGICIDKLNVIVNEFLLEDDKIVIPDLAFFKRILANKTPTYGSNYAFDYINLISQAAFTYFISLTGWRSSEFGFNFNDITVYKNNDAIDQLQNPSRYEIFWYVPKTNGDTKLRREITYQAYECAKNLSILVDASDHTPCLYNTKRRASSSSQSETRAQRAVSYPWVNYVLNYKPFMTLDLIDELNQLKSFSRNSSFSAENKIKLCNLEHQYFSENWKQLDDDVFLRAAHIRSRSELNRVKFYLMDEKRDNYVWQYINNELDSDTHALLETYLSNETKIFLKNIIDISEISTNLTEHVTAEILGDCLYPTPHAFRHIWAEAVYRRFDGDAGWMIRSSFKHINQNMWLAYISDKNNMRDHDQVKRRVISSVLTNHILKSGDGYSGAMDTYLRRIFKNTIVTSLDDIINIVEKFSDFEIKDIKSSPWGYCILKYRNQHRAKCAVDGIPQRHNASPKLCLGCNNNLNNFENVFGILLYISNDLNVISEKNIPKSFYEESYKTVKNALKQLIDLGADNEIIFQIKSKLSMNLNVIATDA